MASYWLLSVYKGVFYLEFFKRVENRAQVCLKEH